MRGCWWTPARAQLAARDGPERGAPGGAAAPVADGPPALPGHGRGGARPGRPGCGRTRWPRYACGPGCAMRSAGQHLQPMRRVRRVHMVGIGGAGMSGIAEVLANQGFAVSGSDLHRVRRHPPPAVAGRGGRPQAPGRECARRRCAGGLHRHLADTTRSWWRPARRASRWCRARRCWPS